mmetsp:Transcript_45598/g.89729  ORF Transcript_45598/g.89729 Transcript_45598/m.89729 type:complete len:670 (+) Transcript_45598:54-2063(+)
MDLGSDDEKACNLAMDMLEATVPSLVLPSVGANLGGASSERKHARPLVDNRPASLSAANTPRPPLTASVNLYNYWSNNTYAPPLQQHGGVKLPAPVWRPLPDWVRRQPESLYGELAQTTASISSEGRVGYLLGAFEQLNLPWTEQQRVLDKLDDLVPAQKPMSPPKSMAAIKDAMNTASSSDEEEELTKAEIRKHLSRNLPLPPRYNAQPKPIPRQQEPNFSFQLAKTPLASAQWHKQNIAHMKAREPGTSACVLLNHLYKKKAQELPRPIHPDRLVMFDPLVDHPGDRASFLSTFFSSRTCVLLLHTPVLSKHHVPTTVNFFPVFGGVSPCSPTARTIFDDIASLEHTGQVTPGLLQPVGINAMPNATQFKRVKKTKRGEVTVWEYDAPTTKAQHKEAQLTYLDQLYALKEDGVPLRVLASMSYISRNLLYGLRSHLLPTATCLSSKIFPGMDSKSLVTHSDHPSEVNMNKDAFEGLALRHQQLILSAAAVEDEGSPDEKTAARITDSTPKAKVDEEAARQAKSEASRKRINKCKCGHAVDEKNPASKKCTVFLCPCKNHNKTATRAGTNSTTAVRSLGLPIIHVQCPAQDCNMDHVVKAKEVSHIHNPGQEATKMYKIYCREGGALIYSARRQCTRAYSSLTVVAPDGHPPDKSAIQRCPVCKLGGY